jgi:hypothetical protein
MRLYMNAFSSFVIEEQYSFIYHIDGSYKLYEPGYIIDAIVLSQKGRRTKSK